MSSLTAMRRGAIAAAALVVTSLGSSPAQAAPSRVASASVEGRQSLDGGYERVYGTVRGVVSGSERVRGLRSVGSTYEARSELIRPPRGRRVRLLVVEAENRGSPVALGALSGSSLSGAPGRAVYRPAVSRFLRAERLAYARVQWQTGFSAGVPATAQGVGEVIVRDFGHHLARRYPRRALMGVSQGAFFVNTFIAEGFNAVPGGRGRAYRQALTVDGNGNWMAINRLAGGGPQDPYLRENGRPLSYRRLLRRPRSDPLLVDVANYTDFYRLRAGLTSTKPPPAGVRRFDWPSPHQSFPPAAVFGGLGCNGRVPIPLSPLRNRPYLRALVRGMARGRLPASRRFALGRAPRTRPGFNGLPGVRVRVPRVDRLSQPVGGVRFPEVRLPLGRLTPVALSPALTSSSGAVCGNSGGFRPFSAAAVARRYSRAAYLRRYARALTALEGGRYLRRAERRSMLAAAAADYDAARRPSRSPGRLAAGSL